MHTTSIEEFLRESNAIEDVHSEGALGDANEAWKYLIRQDELTFDVIQQAHEILLKNRQPEIAGEFRDVPVRVGSDVPPPPEKVEEFLAELLDEPVETGAEAIQWHVRFEKIHPFADGNGRIGRLLYLWHCRSHLGIEPVLWRADDVAGYYDLFKSAPDPTERI